MMEEGAGLQAGPSKSWVVEGEGCVMNGAISIKPKTHFERPTGLINSDKKMGWQESNLGWTEKGDQAQESRLGEIEKCSGGPNAERGPTLIERMPIPIGPEISHPKRWAQVGRGPVAVLEEAILNQPTVQNKGKKSLEKRSLLDCRIASNGSSLEGEHLVIWESEEARKTREKVIPSATDKALAEEAMRYDSGLRIEREMGYGSSHLILGCWDLVEFNKDPNLARGWSGTQRGQNFKKPEVRKRIDGKKAVLPSSVIFWTFRQRVGKGNLNFLIKIRKRLERIHSKELMEKSKFEKELKRLECLVNYEKERKQKSLLQGKGDQLAVD
ncbi:hypothetical protein CK203_110270 [Vitis vinifera]|uniref:Uncharacterized protein n=1 Tax=Vitis vinifera TaxID=29760 RepID=A0A438CAM4_VITVI|nr:hypothetical protein CK203_110270 [Vitis vinifera]